MIIEQTYKLLNERIGSNFPELIISHVSIGLYLTALKLSDETIGVSSTITDNQFTCSKEKRDFNDLSPLMIKGLKIRDVFESKLNTGLVHTLKTAILNAASSTLIDKGDYRIIEDQDPVQMMDLNSKKTITIVGAFQSYIRKISLTGNKLFILEINKNALDDQYQKYYIPAQEFRKVIPSSDIVIITGQTLANGTIDELLDAVSPGTKVIVSGPSVSMIPDILFANKVNIIGAMKITNPSLLFDVVGEGGAGYHLFRYCAKKICIIRKDG